MEPHIYTINIIWQEGRMGIMNSDEINSPAPNTQGSLQVATPPPFNGGVEGIWSPEHLYTAAIGSCLMTTFLAIAENSKLSYSGFACKTSGKLEQVEGKFLMTEVLLEPVITITNEADKERAERIIQKSESACLISNSVKAKISMNSVIVVG